MKVVFKQVRGYSGVDVWTESLASELKRQGIETNLSYFPDYVGYLPYLARFTNKKEDYGTIIHGNTWNGFAFKGENPLVLTEHHVVHDPSFEPMKTARQKRFHKLIYKYEKISLNAADKVTCVSEYTKKMLEKTFGYSDAQVIYNGVDQNIFRPIEINREAFYKQLGLRGNEKVLLFAGNPSNRKGADLLPKIMDRLDDSYVLLMTAGLREGLFSGNKKIICVGKVSLEKLVILYNFCDALIFPSRLEGFGLTVAEAMACGKPVITTNGSALPELIVDGKGGFLCEMDNIDDFVSKIKTIFDDEKLMEDMSEYNQNCITKKFTLDKMAMEYKLIYQKLL
ncbi:glycosyltransferase family 4 protein [Methanoplanus endosymbiosus]|uniref:Glycosyltransferase family 4 protein n=1 Tax=Methanoplanus endosymbiosus TaxID=33865 RepID=A0A9E7PMS1_9EURY|nr:glycosyltransferase family 4 protein [Methanoplanus endosymbiosus]UUX91809.1 glycosyltransferase family 4 protein [Methanoplanus endosymbiosus]